MGEGDLLTGSEPVTTKKWRQAGFTLIEMMVVIFIISVVAALVVPRLPSSESTRLKESARNLATAIRFLNDRAIITKGLYHLRLNINESSVTMSKVSADGEEAPPDDQFLNRRLIEEEITIEDVTAPRVGKITDGEAVVRFGPAGISECLTIHLKGGDNRFTIIAYPAGGRVNVLEGYQEETP